MIWSCKHVCSSKKQFYKGFIYFVINDRNADWADLALWARPVLIAPSFNEELCYAFTQTRKCTNTLTSGALERGGNPRLEATAEVEKNMGHSNQT